MYDTTELKKGVKVELEGKVFVIIKSDFTNPGKGSAFVRCKMKNLENGSLLERTFKSGVSTGALKPDLEQREVSYMYTDTEGFHFMDQNNYETITLTEEQVGESQYYLQEGIKIQLLYWKSKPISIDLPNFVELKVEETDPGLKGDTASGGMKKAKMDTGLQINVPLFIKQGEVLRIDTRTGEYVERVNK